MNLKHDEEWQKASLHSMMSSQPSIAMVLASDFAESYYEHMQRLIPASEWHEDDGDVLWYRLPVVESPYVGSPLDTGWHNEPFAILLNGETRAEYFTHFQRIYTPEH